MNAVDFLLEKKIYLRDFSAGTKKVICPKCSESRRNKTERCLSVTILGPYDLVFHCHHCSWSGGFTPSHERKNKPVVSKSSEWRKKFTSERRW